MDARWGKIVYWAATIIAVLIVVVGVVGYASNAAAPDVDQQRPFPFQVQH